MTALLIALFEANLAMTLAAGAVLAVRRRVSSACGPSVSYLLWAVVPASMAATLAPARTVLVAMPATDAADMLRALLSPAVATALVAVWAVGAMATAAVFVWRQRAFMREARRGAAGPAVVGLIDPWIVTPRDFAQRYTPHEQRLILSHEEVHLERHDARVNALAAAIRVAFWFNPLAHIGARAMRADQETSCDALVVARRPKGARRTYAETLLKTQLATRSLPVGCAWPPEASHPLASRIETLAQPAPSEARRTAGAFAAVGLVAICASLAWAGQPAREIFEASASEVLVPVTPMAQTRWTDNILFARGGTDEPTMLIRVSPGPP